MKALSVDKQKHVSLINIDKPKPNGQDVIMKVSACGVCGSDIHYWDLGQPAGLILGHEFCGTVVDPGSRKDLKKGDRITALPISPCGKCDACRTGNIHYCTHTWENASGTSISRPGAYAEYASLRADMVRKVPANITDEEVAMVEPSAVGLHAVHLANIKVGDSVLVIGGGIIGLMTAEFARLQGASYIAMSETNMARGKFAVKVKAVDECYNALDKNLIEKFTAKVKEGFDVVIDCCGNSPAVTTAIQAVRPGGKIILVGVSMHPITIPSIMAVLKENTIIGAIAYTEKEFDECIDAISNKRVNVTKYLSKVLPLSKGQEAFETLTSGKDSAIKIILKPSIK